MAKKKVYCPDDAAKLFRDVLERNNLSSYCHVNRTIFSIDKNDCKILIIPDQLLWEHIINENIIPIEPVDISTHEGSSIRKWFIYGEDLTDDGWIDMSSITDIYSGEIFNINISDYEYDIPVNKDLMPIKLKKSEYEYVKYKIFINTPLILAIKKRFESPLEEYGFTVMRLFQVI